MQLFGRETLGNEGDNTRLISFVLRTGFIPKPKLEESQARDGFLVSASVQPQIYKRREKAWYGVQSRVRARRLRAGAARYFATHSLRCVRWLPVRCRGSALHVVMVDSCYRVAPGSPQDSQFDRDAYLQSLANEVLLAVRASVASSAASHVPHWQARCRSTTRPVSMTPVRAHRSACALGP